MRGFVCPFTNRRHRKVPASGSHYLVDSTGRFGRSLVTLAGMLAVWRLGRPPPQHPAGAVRPKLKPPLKLSTLLVDTWCRCLRLATFARIGRPWAGGWVAGGDPPGRCPKATSRCHRLAEFPPATMPSPPGFVAPFLRTLQVWGGHRQRPPVGWHHQSPGHHDT